MSTFDLVRVVNTGDTDLVLRGNTVYTIPVGGERIIPFTEAASWFGDPRLQNDGREQLRTLVYRQVQNLWGFTVGMQYLRDRWDPTKGFKTWEDDFKPKAECYDMDGRRIYMVIDDPEGTQTFHGPAIVDPAHTDVSTLQNQIDVMQRQMSQLLEALQQRTVAEQPAPAVEVTSFDAVNLPQPDEDDTVTEDAPAATPTRSRNK